MSSQTPALDSYTSHYRCSFALGASRAGEAGLRTKAHLERALAEIDGLFAGLNFLDETDPKGLSVPGSTPSLPKTNHFSDRIQEELDSLAPSAPPQAHSPPSPPPPPKRDWSAVRNVRDGMVAVWNDFEKLADELESDDVSNIRQQYRDAKGLREAGVFAFRNTLTGPAPNDLKQIFAFTSLSYVVSSLLRDRRRFAERDVLAGIQVWFNAIQCPTEREIFLVLAHRLWPEAKNHLRTIPIHMDDTNRRRLQALHYSQWTNATGDMPGCSDNNGCHFFGDITTPTVDSEAYHTSRSSSNGFYDFCTGQWYQYQPEAAPEVDLHVYSLHHATSETFDFSQFRGIEHPDFQAGSSSQPPNQQKTPGLPPDKESPC